MTEISEVDFEMACTRLATESLHSDFFRALLTKEVGKWYKISEIIGQDCWPGPSELYSTISAVWLPHPEGDVDYAFVLILDNSSMWSSTLTYNIKSLRVH